MIQNLSAYMYTLQVSSAPSPSRLLEGHSALWGNGLVSDNQFTTDWLTISYEASCIARMAITWPNAVRKLPSEMTHRLNRPSWSLYKSVAEVSLVTIQESVIDKDQIGHLILAAVCHYTRVYGIEGLCILVPRVVLNWLACQGIDVTVSGFSFIEAVRLGHKIADFADKLIYGYVAADQALAVVAEMPVFEQVQSNLTLPLVA